VDFVPNQAFQPIALGEPAVPLAMLTDPGLKLPGDTDVERASITVSHDVDGDPSVVGDHFDPEVSSAS
jgi:hypothetical protein